MEFTLLRIRNHTHHANGFPHYGGTSVLLRLESQKNNGKQVAMSRAVFKEDIKMDRVLVRTLLAAIVVALSLGASVAIAQSQIDTLAIPGGVIVMFQPGSAA